LWSYKFKIENYIVFINILTKNIKK